MLCESVSNRFVRTTNGQKTCVVFVNKHFVLNPVVRNARGDPSHR